MSNPRLQVDIGANIKDLEKALKTVESRLSTFGKNLEGIGRTLSTRMTLPLVTAGGAAIKLASDLEESLNKVDVSFRDSSGVVRSFADTTLDSFGIARGSALEMASLFGDMATSMGITTDEAANMSTTLVGLAGDLSSFKNIRLDTAQTALAAIFTGETESLKRLGIVMTQANLEAFALSRGIQKNIQDMTEAEKVNLRYEYVLSKTTNAQGDFARTSEGAANQMRIFQQRVKELGEDFGTIMLPQFTEMVAKANGLVKAFGNLDNATKQLVINIGGLAAVLGPAVIVLGSFATNMAKILALAPKFLKFLAGPGGVALGLGTLAGKGIGAVNSFQRLREEMLGLIEQGETLSQTELTGAIERLAGETREAFENGSTYRFELARLLEALVRINMSKAFVEQAKQIDDAKQSAVELGQEIEKALKPIVKQAAPQDVLILDGLGLGPEIMPTLEQIVSNFERMGFQLSGPLPEALNKTNELAQMFVEGFANGLAQIVIEGGKLGDMLKNIGRQLLQSGLSKLFEIFLTGGLASAGGGFFGKGGGLLGSLLPGVFGAGASPLSASLAVPQLTGADINVGGQFVLKGTDLVGSIIKTQNSILR